MGLVSHILRNSPHRAASWRRNHVRSRSSSMLHGFAPWAHQHVGSCSGWDLASTFLGADASRARSRYLFLIFEVRRDDVGNSYRTYRKFSVNTGNGPYITHVLREFRVVALAETAVRYRRGSCRCITALSVAPTSTSSPEAALHQATGMVLARPVRWCFTFSP